MTAKLYFKNKGIIDLTAISTMGVSVKDEGSIGYFGTGLKFAIATILRNGGKISILRGSERHEFSTETTDVRGRQFNIVTMDGRQLGFTTQLGRDWQPWMAFREIACNCLDEGGEYGIAYFEPDANSTIIEVSGGGMIDAYHDRGQILIVNEPLKMTEHANIHEGRSSNAYYRGVRVGEMMRPSIFKYDVLAKIDLTEDRTFKYEFQVRSALASAIASVDDREVLSTILSAGADYIEHYLSFDGVPNISESFLDVAGALRADLNNIQNANPSAMKIAHARSLSQLGPTESVALNGVENTRYERARDFLMSAGYDLSKYPVIIVADLGSGVYGLAKEDKIFIAKAAFQKGTKEVASTLLEEFVHLETGFADETRQLQTWLFDELLSQAEIARGEPL